MQRKAMEGELNDEDRKMISIEILAHVILRPLKIMLI